MVEEIKIKMDVLAPVFVLLEDSQVEPVSERFVEMVEDIMQSRISIILDEKEHLIDASFVKKKKEKYMRYYKTLVLKFQVDMDKIFSTREAYNNKGEKVILKPEVRLAGQRHSVMTEIEKYYMDFIFAMNLAHPGLFEIGEIKVYFNNKEEKRLRKGLTLIGWLDTYINFLENKWPQIHMLKFETVWKWLNTKTNYMDGISKTAIDRALNALTYTMEDSSYEKIFYILLGLEALYNDNDSNGIVEQIRSKTESLLNRPPIYRKKISTFYNNRSEFVHGKLNFPTKYYPYDATDEFQDFYFNKYIETVDNSMSILIATIQGCIIENKRRIGSCVVANFED